MSKDNVIEIEGIVEEVLPSGNYKIKLVQGHVLMAKVSGRMRMHNIRIVEGDKVKVEVSPYDLNKGRIIYRGK